MMEQSYLYYEDMLRGEYKKVYEKIQTYGLLRAGNYTDMELNDMMMELIDQLHEAQIRKKPVEKIVGTDLEQFCENFYEGDKKRFQFVKRIPKMFYHLCWPIFLIGLIELLCYEGDGTAIYQFESDLAPFCGGILAGMLAASLATMIGKQLLFRWKRFNLITYLVIDGVFTVGGVLLAITYMPELKMGISVLSTVLVSGCYIIIYKGVQFYDRYRKYGSIKKPEEEKMFGFREAWKAGWESGSSDTSILALQAEVFEKKNARRRKKGKPEITEEAFTEKFRKDAAFNRKFDKVCPWLITGFVIWCFFSELDSSLLDACIYAGIMGVIQFSILWGFLKMEKGLHEEREAIIRSCEAEGITMIELDRRRKAELLAAEEAELEENYLENE